MLVWRSQSQMFLGESCGDDSGFCIQQNYQTSFEPNTRPKANIPQKLSNGQNSHDLPGLKALEQNLFSMTKHLLNKFKSSLESSDKKVHDEKLEVEIQEEPEIFESESAYAANSHSDRSELYRAAANHYELSKMAKKVPWLINENRDLRYQVNLLQQQIIDLRYHETSQRALDPLGNSFQTPSKGGRQNYIRIEHQNERVGRMPRTQGQLLKERIKSSTGRDRDSNWLSSPEPRKKNFAKLSSEVIHFFQVQLEQLKLQNQRINAKYQYMVKNKQEHSGDIDKIKKNFEDTLQKQEDTQRKQLTFSEEKARKLESKITQLQSQNGILRMQNWALTERLATNEIQKATQKQNANNQATRAQKPLNFARPGEMWQSKDGEVVRSNSTSRIKFNYQRP